MRVCVGFMMRRRAEVRERLGSRGPSRHSSEASQKRLPSAPLAALVQKSLQRRAFQDAGSVSLSTLTWAAAASSFLARIFLMRSWVIWAFALSSLALAAEGAGAGAGAGAAGWAG